MPNILVPQLGESVVEARVARWLKKVGDPVDAGEPVVELETDKIDLEVGSEQAGVLAKIEREEGTDVKVGEVLAVVEAADAASQRAPASAEATADKPDSGLRTSGTVSAPGPKSGREPETAKPPALEAGQGPKAEAGSPEPTATARVERESAESDRRAAATATARRMAEEHGIDLARVSGTGEGGRVTKEDVQKFIASGPPTEPAFDAENREPAPDAHTRDTVGATHASPGGQPGGMPPAVIPPSRPPSDEFARPGVARGPQPAPAPAPPRVKDPEALAKGDRTEERQRMSKRRLTIAKRLVEAQRTAAMLTTFNEVDMSAVMALRARRKEAFQKRHGVNLGLSSFFVKASIGALRAFPRLNAEIDGEEMVLKRYYDIGIAVGASQGLVVPVLRDADRMSFAGIEHGVRDFAKRAEDGTLTLDDLRGGTFTITNGGVFGSLMSTPILNPPQVGILGLHKIEQRPMAVDGQVVVKPMMYVALSYDHRIVDGAEAVQFLVKVKELVEDPGQMLIEL